MKVLKRLAFDLSKTQSIQVDNDPSFLGKLVDQPTCWNKVILDFSRPEMSTDKHIQLSKALRV